MHTKHRFHCSPALEETTTATGCRLRLSVLGRRRALCGVETASVPQITIVSTSQKSVAEPNRSNLVELPRGRSLLIAGLRVRLLRAGISLLLRVNPLLCAQNTAGRIDERTGGAQDTGT